MTAMRRKTFSFFSNVLAGVNIYSSGGGRLEMRDDFSLPYRNVFWLVAASPQRRRPQLVLKVYLKTPRAGWLRVCQTEH